jgi:hypothetical protein
MYNIYKLVNPKTKLPFYVGRTVQDLEMRLSNHLSSAKKQSGTNEHLGVYIHNLLSKNITPEIHLICRTKNPNVESKYINELGAKHKLYNACQVKIREKEARIKRRERQEELNNKREIARFNALSEPVKRRRVIREAYDVCRRYFFFATPKNLITECGNFYLDQLTELKGLCEAKDKTIDTLISEYYEETGKEKLLNTVINSLEKMKSKNTLTIDQLNAILNIIKPQTNGTI